MTPRPIDTAPKDGSVILIYLPMHSSWTIGWFYGPDCPFWWCGALGRIVEPSHWAPLPPKPVVETEVVSGWFL
jgi:hypothetical protein